MTQMTYAIDATSSNIANVPKNAPYVIGYLSGTPDIQWTFQDWVAFPGRYVMCNYQGYGYPASLGDTTVDQLHEINVESGAISPAEAAQIIARRVARGWQWTTVYASDANLQSVAQATQALGDAVWIGHVLCRLADWNLNQQEAAAKVGTQIHGITCIGAQWASPTSNPSTICPGTDKTLSELQVDLSVVDVNWHDLATQRIPAPTPPTLKGVLVRLPAGQIKDLSSTDGGQTWR